MSWALLLASVIGGLASDPAGTGPAWPGDGYALVWAQEFEEGERADPDVWSFEEGFARNREAQWYQEDNARIENGLLVIEARRERVANPGFVEGFVEGSKDWRERRRHAEITSSSLRTRGKAEWLYGRFELRARIDIGDGLWPAWWSLGSARPWPGCGEIDMMEYYRGMILANACWKKGGDRWAQHWDSVRIPVEQLAGDDTPEAWASRFHVWRMDWNENEIRLYLDGELLNTIDVTKTFNPDGTNPFREPHYMLVNLAVGGTNGGDFSETKFPARFEVDYIRVYQKQD